MPRFSLQFGLAVNARLHLSRWTRAIRHFSLPFATFMSVRHCAGLCSSVFAVEVESFLSTAAQIAAMPGWTRSQMAGQCRLTAFHGPVEGIRSLFHKESDKNRHSPILNFLCRFLKVGLRPQAGL